MSQKIYLFLWYFLFLLRVEVTLYARLPWKYRRTYWSSLAIETELSLPLHLVHGTHYHLTLGLDITIIHLQTTAQNSPLQTTILNFWLWLCEQAPLTLNDIFLSDTDAFFARRVLNGSSRPRRYHFIPLFTTASKRSLQQPIVVICREKKTHQKN